MNYVELTHNLGYVIDDVPTHVLDLIHTHCDKAQKLDKSYTKSLMGHIQNSWEVPFDDELIPLVDYLSLLASEYEIKTGLGAAPEGTRKLFRHQDFWLNHQRKTQFQPPHIHNSDYSFVVWLKVPYSIEDEFEIDFVAQSRRSWAGCFGFISPVPFSSNMEITRIPVDKTYEGKVVLFPASLVHTVCPFYTSDDVRVSFAGNLVEPILINA